MKAEQLSSCSIKAVSQENLYVRYRGITNWTEKTMPSQSSSDAKREEFGSSRLFKVTGRLIGMLKIRMREEVDILTVVLLGTGLG